MIKSPIFRDQIILFFRHAQIYGRSKGAEFALVAASLFNQKFKYVLVNSPSHLVLEGLKGFRNSNTSSWTYHNKELPYTKFSLLHFLIEKLFHKSIKTNFTVNSIIPVEKIKAHLLLIASQNDEIWPAFTSVQEIVKRIRHSPDFQKNYETALYPSCGHMMTVAFQSNHRYPKVPWERIMQDTNDSWNKTINFFEQLKKDD